MSANVDLATARAIERAEIEAWRDAFAAASRETRDGLGLAERDFGHAFALASRWLASLLFNRVIGLGLFEPVTDGTLDAIAAHFAEVGEDHALNVSPLAEPEGLGERLAARGYSTFFHHVKWVRDTSPPAPVESTLRVERVRPERAEVFAGLLVRVLARGAPLRRDWMAESVGRTGWSHYLALDGETPVGCAAMRAHDDVAWLGWGATLPEARGRGAQSLLLAARLDDARAAGCRLATTETGPNDPDLNPVSWRNVQRAGFRVAYDRPSWVRPE
ncbi:MAG: GNAT family N-acetyltransferase [Candidatus Eisenbacteria bacterium]|nr:GNAT family N-acetyltransferase [Candidatus Eisenbacteria bacterium]